MKDFLLIPDANGRESSAIPFAEVVNAYKLTANVAQAIDVPAGANIAVFSCDNDFYAKPGATVTVPAANVTDGTAGELNPVARGVGKLTQIAVISPVSSTLTVSYYK